MNIRIFRSFTISTQPVRFLEKNLKHFKDPVIQGKPSQNMVIVPSDLLLEIENVIKGVLKPKLFESYSNLVECQRSSVGYVDNPCKSKELLNKYSRIPTCMKIPEYTYEECVAYLAGFSLCSYTSLVYIFEVLKKRTDYVPAEVLDIGCGPSTALWALNSTYEFEGNYCGVDANDNMLKLALHLNKDNEKTKFMNYTPYNTNNDMVIIAHVLSELSSDKSRINLVITALQQCSEFLVITERGNPEGYRIINKVRDYINQNKENGRIVAPCQHSYKCPLSEKKEWCCFYHNLRMPEFMVNLRGGHKSNIESHNFIYLVIQKSENQLQKFYGTVMEKPKKNAKTITLKTCTQNGTIEENSYNHTQGNIYRDAKKTKQGNMFPHSPIYEKVLIHRKEYDDQ